MKKRTTKKSTKPRAKRPSKTQKQTFKEANLHKLEELFGPGTRELVDPPKPPAKRRKRINLEEDRERTQFAIRKIRETLDPNFAPTVALADLDRESGLS
jgi:hypothetical protein